MPQLQSILAELMPAPVQSLRSSVRDGDFQQFGVTIGPKAAHSGGGRKENDTTGLHAKVAAAMLDRSSAFHTNQDRRGVDDPDRGGSGNLDSGMSGLPA